jgi:hypothetical protein
VKGSGLPDSRETQIVSPLQGVARSSIPVNLFDPYFSSSCEKSPLHSYRAVLSRWPH